MDRLRRRLGIGLLQLAIGPMDVAAEPPRDIAAPVPPLDGSLDEIPRASVFWERRPGPGRRTGLPRPRPVDVPGGDRQAPSGTGRGEGQRGAMRAGERGD